MINQNDVLLLLSQLSKEGLDTSEETKKLLSSTNIPLSTLKFLNNNRQLDVTAFYERLRSNYNQKKSPLYINIMKEVEDPQKLITTLCALLLQINLFARHVSDRVSFLRWARAQEIADALSMYFSASDLAASVNLIKAIKTDIKVFESLR